MTSTPPPNDPHHFDEMQAPPAGLSRADAAAVDRLLGGDAPSGGPADPRVGAIGRLLDLLRPSPSERSGRTALVDVTMIRVARSVDFDAGLDLAPGDREAVDAFVEPLAGEPAARTGAGERVAELFALLGGPSSGEATRSALVDRTMRSIEHAVDAERSRMRLTPARADELAPAGRGLGRFSLRDLGAVAAVLLIAGAILGPMFAGMRASNQLTRCTAGMGEAGLAMTLFANDHDGDMPARQRGGERPGPRTGPWWAVGQPEHSHSANLFTLVSGGYTGLETLACPGNEHAETGTPPSDAEDWTSDRGLSYSYQLFGHRVPKLTADPTRVVLTDRSPVVRRAIRGLATDPSTPSENHSHLGQNVLFGDGTVLVLRTPTLESGDNIWLPSTAATAGPATLTGFELPSAAGDAFVGP